MKFHHTALLNGLTIVGEQNETAASIAFGFFVKTGARDESHDIAGVSHFLEHMMFKGTKSRSALDINFQLGAIGAQANAYTSEENTVYYMNLLPEYLEKGIEILCDMLRPLLAKEDFDVEKKVILEEIALYQDRPSHVLFEKAMKEFFGENPAGNSVLGSTESITALSREQMLDYFNRRYAPSNIVFCISGSFNWEHVVDLVGNYCGEWKDIKTERTYHELNARQFYSKLTKPGLQLAQSCLLTPGPAANDEARYEAEVLCCILGDTSGSRSFWDLIDTGIADSAAISFEDMDRLGVIYAYLSSLPESLDKSVEIMLKILNTPRDFKQEDLERAKTKIRTRLVLQGESTMRRLMAVGSEWLYNQEYTPLEEDLKRLAAISKDSIFQILDRFKLEPITRVDLQPQ